MSSVFAQRRQKLLSLKALRGSSPAPAHTEEACPACGKAVPRRELVGHRYVCPLCGHHYPVGAYYRLSLILDKGTFRELDAPLASTSRVTFSPTAADMLPMKKRLSRAPTATRWPPMRPAAVTTASFMPVRRRAPSSLAS